MKRLAIVLITFGLLLGCGGGEVRKERIIATSFYPMYLATANVTKGLPGVRVVNITRPHTGCLHDYQLTPEEMKTLSRAAVFVINGGGMEAFLDRITAQFPKLRIINASEGLELITDESGHPNPHLWVSVTGAMDQVKNIARSLAESDPQNAALYEKNAREYLARLNSLRARMTEAAKGFRAREIITFHEAFPYFARELNLKIAAVIEREPGSEPSAKELAETIRLVKSKKIMALFVEPQYPSKAAEAIARETGARIFTLDPVATGPMEDLDYYLKIQEKNLSVLLGALK